MTNLTNQPVASILQRLGRGEHKAYDELVEKYGRLIVWIVRRFLSPRRGDYDDALQDAMLGVWRASPSYDPARGSESTFIRMIVHHRMIERLRRDATGEKTISLDAKGDTVAAPMRIEMHEPQLECALQRLHPEDRELIQMVVIDDMTHAEAARTMGLPLPKVKYMLHRALTQLRRELTPSGKQAAA